MLDMGRFVLVIPFLMVVIAVQNFYILEVQSIKHIVFQPDDLTEAMTVYSNCFVRRWFGAHRRDILSDLSSQPAN